MTTGSHASSMLSLLAFAACAGAAPPPERDVEVAPAATEETARIQERNRVVHLSTTDGRIGLVLDRTTSPPKMRRDGSDEIIELTFAGSRTSKMDRLGVYLADPAGTRQLYIGNDGQMALVDGRAEIPLVVDRSARPLGPATASKRTEARP